jgi:hypothetical protein
MENKTLSRIKNEIEMIQSQLMDIGDMRPGSLTKQYRNPKERTGEFFQISYTHKMKSKTQYVRPQFVEEVRRQIRNYKTFKKLIEKWVALGIQYSQLSMKAEIELSELQQGKPPKPKRRK